MFITIRHGGECTSH